MASVELLDAYSNPNYQDEVHHRTCIGYDPMGHNHIDNA